MNIRTVYMYIYTCGWVVFFFFHDPSLLLKLLEIVPQAKNVVGYQKFLPKWQHLLELEIHIFQQI